MKDEDRKIIVFGLATLFHAARVAGVAASVGPDWAGEQVSPFDSIQHAQGFLSACESSGIAPKLPTG